MFEVLAFVYENYWGADSCPELPVLQRKLNALGFASPEVSQALLWLEDLQSATHHIGPPSQTCSPGAAAKRVFTAAEQARLGRQGWGLLTFLMQIGALTPDRLELVMERALATPDQPIHVDDLKLVVLMMFWSLGEEPDALVLDELCDSCADRLPC
jgi:Smg protein